MAEFVNLLSGLGYEPVNAGKTGGSKTERLCFRSCTSMT